jgi:ABC-type molybdenum transport system ATPase subunit/photorepair protein PhrA
VQATVLILDERTDHLDTEAREALTEAINDFPGVARSQAAPIGIAWSLSPAGCGSLLA